MRTLMIALTVLIAASCSSVSSTEDNQPPEVDIEFPENVAFLTEDISNVPEGFICTPIETYFICISESV